MKSILRNLFDGFVFEGWDFSFRGYQITIINKKREKEKEEEKEEEKENPTSASN